MRHSTNAVVIAGREPSVGPTAFSLGELWQRGARDWRLPPRAVLLLLLVPFLVAAAGVVAALLGKDVYKWFTGEDRFAEDMQVVFYSLALVLNLIVIRQLWRADRKGMALLYVGISLGLVFMVGEELSWGQRMFGWGTPQAFQDANKQGETNLHNIYGVGATFKWLQLVLGAYGTIAPLVVLRARALDRYQATLEYQVPHYTLVPYFLLMFIWRIYRNLVPEPKQFSFVIADYNEVLELILAMGVALFVWYLVRRGAVRRRDAV